MSYGDRQGRARTNARSPHAKGVCDDCGEIYQHSDLKPQMEWSGNSLIWLGFLKCKRCLDKPQDQNRTPILPGDPRPVINPRPEFYVIDNGLNGFTQYTIVPPILADNSPAPDPAKQALFAAVTLISGIVPPPHPLDSSGTILRSSIAQQGLAADQTRTWMLLYNPSNAPLVFSTGNAAFSGDPSAMLVGPGNALFWATAQGSPVYQGAITVIGYLVGQPYWAFGGPGFGQLDFSDPAQSGLAGG